MSNLKQAGHDDTRLENMVHTLQHQLNGKEIFHLF